MPNSQKLENINIDSIWVVEFKSEFYFFLIFSNFSPMNINLQAKKINLKLCLSTVRSNQVSIFKSRA